jgi:hypothetical protein
MKKSAFKTDALIATLPVDSTSINRRAKAVLALATIVVSLGLFPTSSFAASVYNGSGTGMSWVYFGFENMIDVDFDYISSYEEYPMEIDLILDADNPSLTYTSVNILGVGASASHTRQVQVGFGQPIDVTTTVIIDPLDYTMDPQGERGLSHYSGTVYEIEPGPGLTRLLGRASQHLVPFPSPCHILIIVVGTTLMRTSLLIR